MNFITNFQCSIILLVVIYGIMVDAQEEADCELNPVDVETVDVVVYINGDTRVDTLWLSRYCSWKEAGFPYDQYSPVTVMVGGAITCDDDNECNCPNTDCEQAECTSTFYHVCAEQILGQEEYKKLLCCATVFVDEETEERKGISTCVDEQSGLADEISTCMENTGSGSPQEIALANAALVVENGVDLTYNTEPFFFYNGIFNKCISDDSPGWFVQKICGMLNFDIAIGIDQCVDAMGWTTE